MKKKYEYESGTIYVTVPENHDRERLRKVTEEFLKKVIYGGSKNGNGNTSTNFRKE